MRYVCLKFTVNAPFSGSSWHLSRQPLLCQPVSIHGLHFTVYAASNFRTFSPGLWKRLKGNNPEGKNFRKLLRRKRSSAKSSRISRNTLKSNKNDIFYLLWNPLKYLLRTFFLPRSFQKFLPFAFLPSGPFRVLACFRPFLHCNCNPLNNSKIVNSCVQWFWKKERWLSFSGGHVEFPEPGLHDFDTSWINSPPRSYPVIRIRKSWLPSSHIGRWGCKTSLKLVEQLFSFQSPAVQWMARTSSLNCLSCRNPYQTLDSLNCLPPFHWKTLFFTEKCFVASPSQKLALTQKRRKRDFARHFYFSHRPSPLINSTLRSNTLHGVDFGSILGQFLVRFGQKWLKATETRPKTDQKPTQNWPSPGYRQASTP